MKKLKFTIFLLLLLPNIALAADSTPVRRIIEEENNNTTAIQLIDKSGQSSVVYGLAAVVLALIAIFAFKYLMDASGKKPKHHDRKF